MWWLQPLIPCMAILCVIYLLEDEERLLELELDELDDLELLLEELEDLELLLELDPLEYDLELLLELDPLE